MPSIRKAQPVDAAALARLQERTFRDTFEQSNTPEDMALHCRTHYGEEIQRRELLDPAVHVLLSDDHGQLVGFSQLRRGPTPDCISAKRPIEILRFYVLMAWHGKGVAQDLMQASLTVCASHDADQVWLGVWERNPRAIAFYKKWGFEEVGAHVYQVGTDPQRDIVMTRPCHRRRAG